MAFLLFCAIKCIPGIYIIKIDFLKKMILMNDLYVIDQGCTIKKCGIQFMISKNGIKITSVPVYDVERIFIFGNQQITTQAMDLAFENRIDILFLSKSGKLKGKISSMNSKNIYLRLSQYDTWNNKAKRLKISKQMISGKIENQQNLLKKYGIGETRFEKLKNKIIKADDNDELMGYEGIASKIYFENLKTIFPKDFTFAERNRRPPKDEINGLLSLTYTMLLNNILTELEKSGFDSYIGFLHGIKYGRESLGLDMLEEFRQYFCDLFVIKLINRKEIKKQDFYFEDGGCYLNDPAFRKYIKKFNTELEKHKTDIKCQAEKLKKSVMTGECYSPVILK